MSVRTTGLGLLLSATLAAALLPTGAAAQTVVIGVNGNSTGLLNQHVRVPVFADLSGAGGAKLGSYTVRLQWNAGVLFFNGIDSADEGVFSTVTLRQDSASFGVLYIAGINAAGRGGVFDLANLDFFLVSASSSPINVQVLEASAAGTLADLLPSVVAVNGTFCPGDGRWGDLDGDGLSNSRDALAILSSVVGLAVDTNQFKLRLGDVDGDTKIDSRDALIVLSYGVGLPIVGQRILLVAATTCSTGAAPSLKILPDTVDVVPRQQVQLLLTALGGGGRPVALNGVNWQVADGRMATVDVNGALTAVDTGVTTVLVSIGPGVTASAPLIVRSHRPVWHVDPHVAQATVQLGTARFPFETPENAFDLLTEGDTIRVHPGIVTWRESSEGMHVGAVIVGDTLPDGTRPILRAVNGDFPEGLAWYGGDHATVANLVLQSFDESIEAEGLRSLTVRNVRVETAEGTAIDVETDMDSLQVLNSALIGSDASGNGVSINGRVHVILLHNVNVTGWRNEGLYVDAADTVDVRFADVSSNGGSGLFLDGSDARSVLTISHSRFVGDTGETVSAEDVHTILLDHNVFQSVQGAAFLVESSKFSHPDAGSVFRSVGDTIRPQSNGESGSWLSIQQDSVFIDSLFMQNRAGSTISGSGDLDARFAQVTHSKFLNLYGTALQFDGNRLVVDSSLFQGCDTPAYCGWTSGSAIYMSEGLSGSGLGEGPNGLSKGSALITHTSFIALEDGLETGGSSLVGPVMFSHNVVDSVSNGVNIDVDTLSASDNALTRINVGGLVVAPGLSPGQVTMLRNHVTCAATGTGIEVDNQPANISSNLVSGCLSGVVVSAYSDTRVIQIVADTVLSPDDDGAVGIHAVYHTLATLRGNRIVGGGTGIQASVVDTTMAIDSNAVSATRLTAVYLDETSGQFIGTRNNLSNNLQDGLAVYCVGQTPRFNDGRFQGNGGYAINVIECSDSVDAERNWWGLATGPGPGAGSDSVNGGRINTTNFLTADPFPGSVPPLAPRFARSQRVARPGAVSRSGNIRPLAAAVARASAARPVDLAARRAAVRANIRAMETRHAVGVAQQAAKRAAAARARPPGATRRR